ncbi:MAG: ATP-binding cassette domain-containing protein [Candidatus Symbiothrix sp.]|jgi:lipopolysaccharide transport system ATP-binding protein|nr:ATP-binding cassette domain-containing protein [Candidatus Symbiothrix sp.]
MSNIAIRFENISKQYRLGLVSTKTLSHDVNRWWQTSVLGKEDPYLKIGEVNNQKTKGASDYVWALRNISFDVEQGDVIGIIGKNGAGKSTLLKILSRITTPTTGYIKTKGRLASLLEVGTGFHQEMTGRENIYMNGAILGMTKHEIDRKLDAIVEFSGVERYLDTPVKRYSSGMRVRLGFAVAAHLDPDILVVDEVLAVGDAEFQKKAIGKMQDVAQGEGRTVLFVSHNMASIRRLCKTGVILKDGTMFYTGGIDDVVDTYLQEFLPDNQSRSVDFEPDKTLPMSINHIEIYAKGKNNDVIFDTSDTLCVKVQYSVYEDMLEGVNIHFNMFTKDEIVVMRSWDVDNNQELLKGRKKGDYETEFEIPDVVNKGEYKINIGWGKANHGSRQNFNDCICFEIENVKVDGYTKSFSRGGIIKSNINWKLKKL